MRRITSSNLIFVTTSANQLKDKVKCRFHQASVISVCLLMIAILLPCSSGSSQPTQVPEPMAAAPEDTAAVNGAKLLETRCSSCHSSDKPKHAQKTLEEWEKIVTRMISKGAKLNDAEKTALVDYLAKTYGP